MPTPKIHDPPPTCQAPLSPAQAQSAQRPRIARRVARRVRQPDPVLIAQLDHKICSHDALTDDQRAQLDAATGGSWSRDIEARRRQLAELRTLSDAAERRHRRATSPRTWSPRRAIPRTTRQSRRATRTAATATSPPSSSRPPGAPDDGGPSAPLDERAAHLIYIRAPHGATAEVCSGID